MNGLEQVNSIFPLIKIINEGIEKKANQALQQFAITFSQMRILMTLYYSADGTYALKELEKIFNLSQQTIAGTVSRLQKKELVASYTDQKDKRIKKVTLTPKGIELSVRAKEIMEETEKWLCSELSSKEQDIFLSLLQKISVNM